MKTVFIFSYNQLRFSFWKSHLNISEDCQVFEFESGIECVKALRLDPSVVVIDEYFSPVKDEDLTGTEVAQIFEEITPELRCFHVSPANDGKAWTLDKEGVIYSDINADLLAAINRCVQTRRSLAA